MRWYAVTKWLLCMDTGREGTVYVAYSAAGTYKPRFVVYVIVIAWGQGFMAVNQPSPEGAARGRGWFTLP